MSLKNTVRLYDTTTIQSWITRLVPSPVHRILDLGGGRGGNGAVVKQLTGAAFLCLADLNDAALAQAPAMVDASMVCDIGKEGALEAVFAAHGPFDLVLLLDVLEHLYDPWRTIAQLHGLLREGGYLLASIPNIQDYRTVIRAATGTWRYRDIGLFDRTHLRFLRQSAPQSSLSDVHPGLTLVDQDKGYGSNKHDRLIDRASFGLLGRFTTMQHQILVRKERAAVIDPQDFVVRRGRRP